MLAAAQSTNLAVRFLLELVLLTAVGAAAWDVAGPGPLRWLAVVAAPLVVAVGWVLVVHGDGVPAPVQVAGQVVALVVSVACLVRIGADRAAVAVAVTALVNAALIAVWNQ